MAIFPGWRQVALTTFTQGVAMATILNCYSVISVPLHEAFHPSRMVLTLGITLIDAVGGLAAPLLGAAMDRHSMRMLMFAGTALLGMAFLALSFTTSMIQVLVIYAALMSIACMSLGPIATNTLIARWFTRRRGMAMGIAALGASVASFIFPPFLQGLIGAFGWRSALQLLAAMVVIILVPVIYFLAIDRPSDRNLYPDGDVGPSMTATLQSMAPRLTSGTVFRDPNFWLIAFATGVPFAGLTGLMGSMVPLAISKGVSATSAALLLSSLAAGLFAGKILFAGVADRTNLRIALGVCLLGVSVSMLCFWYAAGYMMMVFGSFLLGAAIGVMGTLWGLLLSRGFGTENLGLVMGLVAMVKMPVQLSAPPFFGFVFDKTASYDGALLLVAALCASALVFLPYLRTRAPTVAVPAMS